MADVRVAYMKYLSTLSVCSTMVYLYPHLFALHSMEPEDGFPEGRTGRIQVPKTMRCGYPWMEAHGAYLLGMSLCPSLYLLSMVLMDVSSFFK